MFYLVCKVYHTMREPIGWTDNQYILSEYIKKITSLEVLCYDCKYDEFLTILEEDFDITSTTVSISKLQIIHTKSNIPFITTQMEWILYTQEIETSMGLVENILRNTISLDILSKYLTKDDLSKFILYILYYYVYEMAELYKTGDIANSNIDLLYVLLNQNKFELNDEGETPWN